VKADLARQGFKMVLKVKKYGSAVLREKSIPVKSIGPQELRLVCDMIETMHSTGGVGLAAQQVGRLERVCVIDIPEGCENKSDEIFNKPVQMPLIMFNPQIISLQGEIKDKEGCLSFPDVGGQVVRAEQAIVTYFDEKGESKTITVRGFLARAVQHEVDHLDGILYVDRMTVMERLSHAKKLKKLAKGNGGVK
jgi:peptide deformylase